MENIFSHIAYLLTKHECVIIPGFGALVHSYMPTNVIDEDIFASPAVSLGFNSELKHNDGILADSIKREQKISYNDANKMVSDFSARLDDLLKNKKEVVIPQVGRFRLSENKKISFSPATDLSANAGYFGFKNFYMPLLSEINVPLVEEEPKRSRNEQVIMIPLNKRLLTAVSVAAAVLILMLFSTPIDNRDVPMQYAGMFSSQTFSMPEVVPVDLPEELLVENVEKADTTAVLKEAPEEITPVQEEVSPVVKSSKEYLIIIASFPNRREADRMLPHFQKEFDSASVIERSDRTRIYIRSFQDKSEAEYFLNNFREDYPKHKDAWLLSNRVRS